MGKFIFHRLSPAELSWEEKNATTYHYDPNLIQKMDDLIEKINRDIREAEAKKKLDK